MSLTRNLVKLSVALLLSVGHSAFADAELQTWQTNYQKLVHLLQSTSDVGNCGLSLSGSPGSPDGTWLVNFLRRPEGISSFMIIPPTATRGESQVRVSPDGTFAYRVSDMAGWTNMLVKTVTTQDGHTSVVQIDINKTLPDGSSYQKNITCKAKK